MTRPTTPLLAVDIIIELVDQPERPILLIERRYPPQGWAIPGGFVDVGETLEDAARREAREETNLNITLTSLLGCYSDPQRDVRGHTVSAVYIATATGTPRALDDAKNIALFTAGEFPVPLAFDHRLILENYLRFRVSGEHPALR